eukprot:jgi/Mesvir1/12898/Mv05924-RA.1
MATALGATAPSVAEPANATALTHVFRGHRKTNFISNFLKAEKRAQNEKPKESDEPLDPHNLEERRFTRELINRRMSKAMGGVRAETQGDFNLEMLVQLKAAFDAADTDGSGALDKEEFLGTFRSILAAAKKEKAGDLETQLAHLFMKIDANSDGTVDWEEFTNHIFLEQMARDEDTDKVEGWNYVRMDVKHRNPKVDMQSAVERTKRNLSGSRLKEDASLRGVGAITGRMLKRGLTAPGTDKVEDKSSEEHQDSISKIIYADMLQSYLTGGRDGTIRLWSAKGLQQLRMVRNGPGWITDMATLGQQPLAVLSIDRTISFYDVGRSSLDPLGRIYGLDSVPMCCTYVRVNEFDLFLYGDDTGTVTSYTLDDLWGGEGVPAGTVEQQAKKLPGMTINAPMKFHTDWVTKIVHLSHLNSLITSSLDSTLKMIDFEKQEVKWTATGHARGVHNFHMSRSYNVVASCGVERNVLLWNPFTGRSMGMLQGHTASVLDVVMNDDYEVVSLAADKVVKIWDIRSNKCLQTLQDKAKDALPITAIAYEPKQGVLLTGTIHLDAWYRKDAEDITEHALCSVLFNTNFGQVVTADVHGKISVWSLENGSKVFGYKMPEGTRLSSVIFDISGRRLLSGAEEGTLTLWNFNNGQQLEEFTGFGESEISCCSFVKEGQNSYVAAAGWNHQVCIWEEMGASRQALHHTMTGHTDDVTCMLYVPPNLLATGGYDGIVILWKIDGTIKGMFSPPDIADRSVDEKAVNKMLFLPDLGNVLVTCSEDGWIRFWRINDFTLVFEVFGDHFGVSIHAMTVNTATTILYTADLRGYVKAWDLKEWRVQGKKASFAAPVVTGGGLKPGSSRVLHKFTWRAHEQDIVAMDYTGEKNFLLTAATDGRCRLWTEQGALVGTFGASQGWDLNIPQTYEEMLPAYVNESMPCEVRVGGWRGFLSADCIEEIIEGGAAKSPTAGDAGKGGGVAAGEPGLEERPAPEVEDELFGDEGDLSDTEDSAYLAATLSNVLEKSRASRKKQLQYNPILERRIPIHDLSPIKKMAPRTPIHRPSEAGGTHSPKTRT